MSDLRIVPSDMRVANSEDSKANTDSGLKLQEINKVNTSAANKVAEQTAQDTLDKHFPKPITPFICSTFSDKVSLGIDWTVSRYKGGTAVSSIENFSSSKLSQTELVAGLNDERSTLTRFAQSFADAYVYRALVAPAEAISQVINMSGSDAPRQKSNSADSAEFHGQIFGDAAAMATHLLLAKKICGSVFPKNLEASAASKFESLSLQKEFVKGAGFGFGYQALLQPSSAEDLGTKGLVRSRLENGLAGAAVFGTMHASAGLLKNIGINA